MTHLPVKLSSWVYFPGAPGKWAIGSFRHVGDKSEKRRIIKKERKYEWTFLKRWVTSLCFKFYSDWNPPKVAQFLRALTCARVITSQWCWCPRKEGDLFFKMIPISNFSERNSRNKRKKTIANFCRFSKKRQNNASVFAWRFASFAQKKSKLV